MRVLDLLLLILAFQVSAAMASVDCDSGKDLTTLASEAQEIVLGVITATETIGSELADGSIDVGSEPVVGREYRGVAVRVRLGAPEWLKGVGSGEIQFMASLPILSLGNCPELELRHGTPVLVFLHSRGDTRWLYGGVDGLIHTSETELAALRKRIKESIETQP